jgi:hypothetical protein
MARTRGTRKIRCAQTANNNSMEEQLNMLAERFGLPSEAPDGQSHSMQADQQVELVAANTRQSTPTRKCTTIIFP